jgi:hypothetical protein
MSLEHVKDYLETLPQIKGIELVLHSYASICDAYGNIIVGANGYITRKDYFSIHERMQILKELDRPEEKMRVSEFLLAHPEISRRADDEYCIAVKGIATIYAVVRPEEEGDKPGLWWGSSWWDDLSPSVLRRIAEAKELLEEGELVHG